MTEPDDASELAPSDTLSRGVEATPASGTPAHGTPASGTPAHGTPASGTRTRHERRVADAPTITVPIVLPLYRHTRAWMVVAGTLGIMLIAALVIAGYLWNVNGKWQAQVDQLTDTGYVLGGRIAEHQTQIEQLQSTNGLLADQLANAKERVLTLSNEKSQWRDDTAFAQQQVEQLADQLVKAMNVATQMNRCVEGEQQLLVYIRAGEEVYPVDQVVAFERSVNDLCDAAFAARNALEQELTE